MTCPIPYEYKKLEALAFEVESAIAFLEDQHAFANEGKDLATCRAESLACDLEALSNELHISNSELSSLKDEVSVLDFVVNQSKVTSTIFRELVWKKPEFMQRKLKILLNLCRRRILTTTD
ncbi:hypothetical protein OROHE_007971 [Orobanche hederae]